MSVITRVASHRTSSRYSPLPSDNISRMSNRARRAAEFHGKTRALRLGQNVHDFSDIPAPRSCTLMGSTRSGSNPRTINKCMHVNIYAYIYTHIYTYTHIHIYTYTHIHIYTYTHIHIYTYTQTQTQTQTQTHTHMRIRAYAHFKMPFESPSLPGAGPILSSLVVVITNHMHHSDYRCS